jgi:hypothetical protein
LKRVTGHHEPATAQGEAHVMDGYAIWRVVFVG